MQIRVRCVGSEGSGHGKYSEPVTVITPGNRKAASKPPSARSEASSAAGELTSSALALRTPGKGRVKPELTLPSEEDFSSVAVSNSKKKLPRGKRKGGMAY